jgi:hypothetical protein
MRMIFIGAAKSASGGGGGRRRKPTGRTGDQVVAFTGGSGRGGGDCVDQVARDMACAAVLLWANTLAVTVDVLVQTGLPRDVLHEVLDRIDGANDATLDADSAKLAHGFVQTIRERLAAND